MTKRVKTPGSEAIPEARQAFREEYPHATDWQIKRLALLSVARDAFEAQVAAGQNIDLGALLRIDEVIEQTRETIKKTEPMKVTVEFVHGAAVTCPSCSHEFNPHTSEPVKPFRGVVACHKCGAKSEVSNKPFDAPESQPQQPSSGDPAPLLCRACAAERQRRADEGQPSRQCVGFIVSQPSHQRSRNPAVKARAAESLSQRSCRT